MLPLALALRRSMQQSATSYLAHLTLHILLCTSYFAHLTLHILRCTSYLAHLTLHILLCTSYLAHLTLHILRCTSYVAHLTLHMLLSSFYLAVDDVTLRLVVQLLYSACMSIFSGTAPQFQTTQL
jgi:hypothetical protein